MSNVFGVPPPPPVRVYEPASTATAPRSTTAAPGGARRWREPETHRGRRRIAVLTAFLAGVLVMTANLAVWLHLDAAQPQQADAVASATYPRVVADVQPQIVAVLVPLATRSSDTGLSVAIGDPQIEVDVDAAVDRALAAPPAAARWRTEVADALASERARLDDAQVASAGVAFDATPIQEAAVSDLAALGYSFAERPTAAVVFTIPPPGQPGTGGSVVVTLSSLWWLVVLAAIGTAALSICIATRRVRMSAILAADAAVLLAASLLVVPLMRRSVDARIADSVQSGVLGSAFDSVIDGFVAQTVTLAIVAACAAVGLAVLGWARRRSRPLETAA